MNNTSFNESELAKNENFLGVFEKEKRKNKQGQNQSNFYNQEGGSGLNPPKVHTTKKKDRGKSKSKNQKDNNQRYNIRDEESKEIYDVLSDYEKKEKVDMMKNLKDKLLGNFDQKFQENKLLNQWTKKDQQSKSKKRIGEGIHDILTESEMSQNISQQNESHIRKRRGNQQASQKDANQSSMRKSRKSKFDQSSNNVTRKSKQKEDDEKSTKSRKKSKKDVSEILTIKSQFNFSQLQRVSEIKRLDDSHKTLDPTQIEIEFDERRLSQRSSFLQRVNNAERIVNLNNTGANANQSEESEHSQSEVSIQSVQQKDPGYDIENLRQNLVAIMQAQNNDKGNTALLSPEEKRRMEKVKLKIKALFQKFFRKAAASKNRVYFIKWVSYMVFQQNREKEYQIVRKFIQKKLNYKTKLHGEFNKQKTNILLNEFKSLNQNERKNKQEREDREAAGIVEEVKDEKDEIIKKEESAASQAFEAKELSKLSQKHLLFNKVFSVYKQKLKD